jgi:hypothetical protein
MSDRTELEQANQGHTPGPWTVEPAKLGQLKIAGPLMERGGRYRRIATLGSPRSYVNEELDTEIAANAHLIAAAPELYEALELAERLYVDGILFTPNEEIERVHAARRAALRKARGEQP